MLKYETKRMTKKHTQLDQYLVHTRYGIPHQITLPAMIWENGKIQWREYGDLHRYSGPALIGPNGIKIYFYRGSLQDAKV